MKCIVAFLLFVFLPLLKGQNSVLTDKDERSFAKCQFQLIQPATTSGNINAQYEVDCQDELTGEEDDECQIAGKKLSVYHSLSTRDHVISSVSPARTAMKTLRLSLSLLPLRSRKFIFLGTLRV